MENLHSYGVSTNIPKSKFVDILSCYSSPELKSLRVDLFTELPTLNLMPEEFKGIPLVTHCDSSIRPNSKILSEDCWALADCILNNTYIHRTLLKNEWKM